MLLSLGEAPIVNTITVIFIPIVNNSAMAMHAIVSKRAMPIVRGKSQTYIYLLLCVLFHLKNNPSCNIFLRLTYHLLYCLPFSLSLYLKMRLNLGSVAGNMPVVRTHSSLQRS